MACDSTNRDRVLHTLNNSLPAFVIPLLPKGRNYNKDFDTLCKHIGELSNRELYDAWRDRALLESIGSLSLSIPPTASSPSPHSRSALPTAARATSALKTLSVAPATPKRGSQVSFNETPRAAAALAVPPPIPPPAFSSPTRQQPPHMPSTPAPTPAPVVATPGRPTVPNTPTDQA
ncbi:hypothetical protein RhiLY_10119 [Ceratobasidium sp. AG-Ba]|nr:hypothetical protein RhiLY_10119 [Ceratobasidium sp. AG-Ba]